MLNHKEWSWIKLRSSWWTLIRGC